MAVQRRTKTLRRDLAQTIRGELASYRDMVDDRPDRILLDVVSDIGALCRLEGFTLEGIATQLVTGWRQGGIEGQSATRPQRKQEVRDDQPRVDGKAIAAALDATRLD